MEKTLEVKGMHCKSCEALLTDVASEIDGVRKAAADSRRGTLTVSCSDAAVLEAVKRAIEKEGYKVC
jgi:copper chaperone CopZ